MKFWAEATQKYQDQMAEPCLTYLSGRGISMDSILRYRLGWVSNPLPEHEIMRGRLCIPYLKKGGIVALKFRCIQEHHCKDFGHVKYLSDGNQWLFNTRSLDEPGDTIGLCEGELDAITLTSIGVPGVGIPGVESWKGHPWWAEVIRDIPRILIFADNDSDNPENPGYRLAREIQKSIPRARMVALPERSDVNSTYTMYGETYLKELAGV